MTLIADIFLVAGALAAGFYCFVLSRRLAAFQNAEGGIGHVVASLSAQVDELEASVDSARKAANSSNRSLSELTSRAEEVAQRLELMIASMHDIPEVETAKQQPNTKQEPVFSTRVSRAVGA
ncbi:MAG: DUF6468 domain-containing protein [Planktotalea sp.]|uniref:DUF6468 domain-containing protein n=1 Tax=Planktotalea sp. TaxID=2029877 RepID=UPI003C76AA95